MSVLNLFPERIRFVNPDGTLTREAARMLEVLVSRVGGTLGDMGGDVFASPPASAHAQDMLAQQLPAEAQHSELVMQPGPGGALPGDVVQQPLDYSAGTGIVLFNLRFSLKDTTVGPDSYGAADSVPKFTVDQQGRLTAVQNVAIAITSSQVSGLGSMAAQDTGTNFNGSFTGKTVTVSNGIITSVV
jgi:hypothetical protein